MSIVINIRYKGRDNAAMLFAKEMTEKSLWTGYAPRRGI